MKKYLLLMVSAILINYSSFAKIWRVNNTGVTADFTTAQTAHDNASVANGDTLHFEASGLDYGTLSMSKRLIIIGNGYFLGSTAANDNVDLQANTAPSFITNLYIGSGANNSVIMGMTFNYVYIGYGGLSNNLLFRRNRVTTQFYFYSSGTTNIQVLQNYFDGNIVQNGSHTNALLDNNIIIGQVTFDADDNGTFQNNVLHATGGGYASYFTNFTLRSNIMVAGSISMTSCIVENNISGSTYFGTTNGNQNNVTMSNVFTGYPTIGTTSFDGRFDLQNPGPAIGTGFGGTNCGAYGGSSPYVKSGMPTVPSIYKLSAPALINNNSLNVTISTKINQ